MIDEISTIITSTNDTLEELKTTIESLDTISDTHEKGVKYYYEVCPLMLKVREQIDKYEKIASKEIYTLPTYTDLLYSLDQHDH